MLLVLRTYYVFDIKHQLIPSNNSLSMRMALKPIRILYAS